MASCFFRGVRRGTDLGEFNIPHNIATDRDGYVYVADRESHRVQIFDSNGRFETEWVDMHRPCTVYISDAQDVYVGELGAGMNVNRDMPNIGPRVSIMTTAGKVLERLGSGYGLEDGQFIAPHGICVDSQKSIYVGEVAHTNISHTATPPDNVRALQKLALATP
jgi:DNA-binding beta-propeller fold protein YncE